ncbi:MAG: carboxymuconolactone decarboxylase family protein [Actinoplanes sp.]
MSAADRLPLPAEADLTPEQRAAAKRLAAGPRGGIFGPFVPLLRSPELMTRLQLVGEYLRFDSVLDDDLVELVILAVARHWDQDFEYGFHHPLALQAGLPAEVVDAVSRGVRPVGGRAAVGVVWDLLDELHTNRKVSEATYIKAVREIGETKVVEVVGTAGYYTTLAMTMNVAQTPPPHGAPRLPVRESA